MPGVKLRVVSWNVAYRVGASVHTQAALLASLSPDLVLLQEANRSSVEMLAAEAGLAWLRCAIDVRIPGPEDRPVRRRGVAIAGRTQEPVEVKILEEAPLPERTLIATVPIAGQVVTLVSYHAPPGVSWFEKKPQQAVVLAHFLAQLDGPVLFGADANTPERDAIDFAQTRTHWHSGDRKLGGASGDDLLVGPGKIHRLNDALRVWLDHHPCDLARLRAERPAGPLAVSYRSGRRKTHPGTDRRFDAIWVSPDFTVSAIDYPYDESLAAGSDHSAVVAELILLARRA